jgi:short-subunit dehydrogenase
MERVIRDTTDEYGRLDLIFNNAGISANGEFQDIPMEFWQKIVDVNLMGVVHGCRYAYPVMMRQGSGHIINVASLAGLIPGGPYTPYSATKHAVAGFSLSLRGEAKQHGIKVTALCPGYLRTNIQNTTPNFSTYMETENSGGLSRKFPAPDKFIPAMVRGVMRNRAVVIAPGAQRVFWWLHRLAPGLIPKLTCRMIGYMKKKQRPA